MDEKTPINAVRALVDEYRLGFPIGGNISALMIHKGPVEAVRDAVRKLLRKASTWWRPDATSGLKHQFNTQKHS